MGSFTKGLLVGLGLSLLFAPMKGEEMRRLVAERAKELREGTSDSMERQRLTSRVQEVSQPTSYTSQTGTAAPHYTPQTAGVTQQGSGIASQQSGTTGSAGSTGSTDRSSQTGTNRSQTGQNPPDTRPKRSTP